MTETTGRRKAIKLKTPVTRDGFYIWNLNHQAFCCQEPSCRQFFPDMVGINTWLPKNEDPTRGIAVYKKDNRGVELQEGHGNRIIDQEATTTPPPPPVGGSWPFSTAV